MHCRGINSQIYTYMTLAQSIYLNRYKTDTQLVIMNKIAPNLDLFNP